MKLIRRSSGRFIPRSEFSASARLVPELRPHRRPSFTLNTREDTRGPEER